MPKKGDSYFTKEMLDKTSGGGHVIPKYLRPAMEKILEDMAKQSIFDAKRLMISHGKTSAASFGALSRMTKVPAQGIVHKWSESPFPYGTVIRPTEANINFRREMRQMVIGVNEEREAIVSLELTRPNTLPPGEFYLPPGEFYLHSLSNLTERWEEAPD